MSSLAGLFDAKKEAMSRNLAHTDNSKSLTESLHREEGGFDAVVADNGETKLKASPAAAEFDSEIDMRAWIFIVACTSRK